MFKRLMQLNSLPPTRVRKKGTCKRGKAFHPDEDKVIYSAWLNVSKDSTIGLSSL
jgi:hypothetical protein